MGEVQTSQNDWLGETEVWSAEKLRHELRTAGWWGLDVRRADFRQVLDDPEVTERVREDLADRASSFSMGAVQCDFRGLDLVEFLQVFNLSGLGQVQGDFRTCDFSRWLELGAGARENLSRWDGCRLDDVVAAVPIPVNSTLDRDVLTAVQEGRLRMWGWHILRYAPNPNEAHAFSPTCFDRRDDYEDEFTEIRDMNWRVECLLARHGGKGHCGTAHCRAGWAVATTGSEGEALEALYGPSTAGALIYAASTKRPVPNFFVGQAEAEEDIRACAGAPEEAGA